MKGLQIDFRLKRQTKIGKIMNYLLVLSLFILCMAFVYTQYIDRQAKKNEAYVAYTEAQNKYNQESNEKSEATSNNAEDKAYQADYEKLCAALGTTLISFEIQGETIEIDKLDEEIGYYTSYQDKIVYLVNAMKAFNDDYESVGISAKYGNIIFNSTDKLITLDISFEGNTLAVSDCRTMMKNKYMSKAYLPFVTVLTSQTSTEGIDQGLELTINYAE